MTKSVNVLCPYGKLMFCLCSLRVRYLVNQGCIKPLCDLLTCPDPRIVTVSLEGLENILKVGEQEKDAGTVNGANLYARFIDEAEGLEKIENLQTHDNNEIYEKAVKILETYWLEEDEDQNTAPGTEGGQNFAFGQAAAAPPGGFNFG
jgi:importin subunit alpha-1